MEKLLGNLVEIGQIKIISSGCWCSGSWNCHLYMWVRQQTSSQLGLLEMGYSKITFRRQSRFQTKMAFEKVTLAFVIISLLLQLIAVGMFFGMFSKNLRLNLPATLVIFAAFVFLLVAVIVYGSGITSKTGRRTYISKTSFI